MEFLCGFNNLGNHVGVDADAENYGQEKVIVYI